MSHKNVTQVITFDIAFLYLEEHNFVALGKTICYVFDVFPNPQIYTMCFKVYLNFEHSTLTLSLTDNVYLRKPGDT